MTCIKCNHDKTKRFGTYGKTNIQRYRCHSCSSTFSEPRHKPLGAHYTDIETAVRIVALITEGMSIRAVCRLTGVHKSTILSLLQTVGHNCRRIFDLRVRGLHLNFVQADELWGFIHTKEKRRKHTDPQSWGDAYVWIAMDSDAKAVLSYHVGKRDSESAYEFIGDLRTRIDGRCQVTTDGFTGYVTAMEEHFGDDADFANS